PKTPLVVARQTGGWCSPPVYRFVSAFPRGGGRFTPPGGSTVSTVPPAARIASAAEAETAWTRTVSGFEISPRPRSFTRPCLWTSPRARRVSGVTSVPASKSSSPSRLMIVYSMRNGFLKPFSFGVRRTSGVWPPSNLGGILPRPRVPWPLVPVPAVLPRRPPTPRATRRFCGFEPGAGFKSWILVGMGLLLLHRDQVGHAGHHAPDLRPVGQDIRRVDPAEPERPQRPPGLRLRADGRLHQRDLDLPRHHGTSTTARCGRLRSL